MPSVREHIRPYKPPRFRKKTCPYCKKQVSFAFKNYQRHEAACIRRIRHEKEQKKK